MGKERLNPRFPTRHFPLPGSELYPGVSAISELEWRWLEVQDTGHPDTPICCNGFL